MYLKPPQPQSTKSAGVSSGVFFPRMRNEEVFNVLSHLGAAMFSLVGLFLMIFRSAMNRPNMIIPSFIFGLSMGSLFASSAYWHSLKQGFSHESKFQKLDEIMIYFMIVGTFTPISVLYIPNPIRNWLLVSMWALAISGALLKIFYPLKNRTFVTLIYLGMGWMPAIASRFFIINMATPIFLIFLAGGVFHSLGAILYIARKPDYFHELFHVMVVLGAFCHFLVVFLSL